MKTRHCCLILLLMFMITLTTTSNAQQQGYKYTKHASVTDLTTKALSGTSVWKYINGTPQCKLNSLAQGYNLDVWCLGINDNLPYRFNPQTKQWDKHAEMGTAAVQLVLYDGLNDSSGGLYSLQIGTCPVKAGVQFYQLNRWDVGAQHWTSPNPNSCATNYSFGVDKFLAAAGWDANTNQRALYYSKDLGVTWTLWSDSWYYVNMNDTNLGCAINSGGGLYQVGLSNNAIPEPGLPSGTAIGCILLRDDDSFLAWNAAGTLYMLQVPSPGWQTVAGLTVNQVTGVDKGDVIALNTSGKPYHWNFNAPTITATTTGTFDNFPMGGLNPPPQHTSHLRIKYPHGINANLPAHVQTIPYNGGMSNSFTDSAPLCDPYYGSGGASDPECQPNVDVNYAECSVAGPLAVTPDNSTQGFGLSIDNIEWSGAYNSTAPKLDGNGNTGDWLGIVRNRFQDACGFTGGTPSCMVDQTWNYVADYIGCDWFNDPTGSVESTVCLNWVLNQMSVSASGGYSPWTVFEYYVQEGGAPVCLGPHNAIHYSGDYFLQPPCQ